MKRDAKFWVLVALAAILGLGGLVLFFVSRAKGLTAAQVFGLIMFILGIALMLYLFLTKQPGANDDGNLADDMEDEFDLMDAAKGSVKTAAVSAGTAVAGAAVAGAAASTGAEGARDDPAPYVPVLKPEDDEEVEAEVAAETEKILAEAEAKAAAAEAAAREAEAKEAVKHTARISEAEKSVTPPMTFERAAKVPTEDIAGRTRFTAEAIDAEKKAEIKTKAQAKADEIAAAIAADREAKEAKKPAVDTAAAIAAAAVAAATGVPAPIVGKHEISRRESSASAEASRAIPAPASDPQDRSRWIVKAYKDLAGDALLDSPVNALWGVSEGDAALLKDAFGIKTIRDLATNRFFAWADEIVAEADGE